MCASIFERSPWATVKEKEEERSVPRFGAGSADATCVRNRDRTGLRMGAKERTRTVRP